VTIAAKYEDGVFKPLENVNMAEGRLVKVHVSSYADRLRGRPRSLKDFGFYGTWKDREDLADAVEYINSLRATSEVDSSVRRCLHAISPRQRCSYRHFPWQTGGAGIC
jgi:predicted DNA-binding antitoxin AbrB/MazE fold protein